MPRTWTRWTPDHAALVLGDLDASGLTLTEFARRRGLCVQRLRRWRDRLAPVPAGRPRLVELVPAGHERDAPAERKVSILVHCPSGHVLELQGVEPDHGVLTILRALTAATC